MRTPEKDNKAIFSISTLGSLLIMGSKFESREKIENGS
jgi:hypothetical protein